MSAIVYREPYQFYAGILAVAVHGIFFALLYFGFTWQMQPVATTMSVELWQSLPGEAVAVNPEEIIQPPQPEEIIKQPEVERKAVPHEKIVVPDIVMPDKKKIDTKDGAKAVEKEREARIIELAAREQADQAAKVRADQAAATGRVVNEYTAKIISKVRSNVVMPPDVAKDARAEFMVTLLPGGTVLSAKLVKSSGNETYDDAVERAILKSQPLPLPQDTKLFNNFRELKLVFRPNE